MKPLEKKQNQMRMKEGHEDPASHHRLGFTYISRASASSPLFFTAENSLLLPGAKSIGVTFHICIMLIAICREILVKIRNTAYSIILEQK